VSPARRRSDFAPDDREGVPREVEGGAKAYDRKSEGTWCEGAKKRRVALPVAGSREEKHGWSERHGAIA
jgi:hypothetical protein